MSSYESSLRSISKWLKKGALETAIAECEKKLATMPASPFHVVIGRSWKEQIPEAAKWLLAFYQASGKQLSVESLYCEMNRFEINTDCWYLDGFAYDYFGGEKDTSWLTDWRHSTDSPDQLVLKHSDDIQSTFAQAELSGEPAEDLAILLLTLRMLELVDGAAKLARSNGWLPENVPVITAAHDADPVYFSFGKIKPKPNPPSIDRPVITANPPAEGWSGIYQISGGYHKGESLQWDLVDDVRCDARGYFEDFMEAEDTLCETLCVSKRAAEWTPPRVKIRKRDWRRDIYGFYTRFWSVNGRAKSALSPLLRETVEFLPLDVKAGPELWVIHPLRHIPLSDEAVHNGKPGHNISSIRKYAFAKSDLSNVHLFSIQLPKWSPTGAAGHCGREVFVSDEFKRVFVERALSGIVFNEVFRYPEGE